MLIESRVRILCVILFFTFLKVLFPSFLSIRVWVSFSLKVSFRVRVNFMPHQRHRFDVTISANGLS